MQENITQLGHTSDTARNATPVASYDQLMLIAQGHAAFQLLWAGCQLGLFEELSRAEGYDLHGIRRRLGLQEKPTRILLTGLLSLGLLEKQEEQYRNAPIAEMHLVGEGNLGPVLGWQHHIVYPGLVDFVDSLRANRNVGLERFPGTGPTLYERLSQHPLLEKTFHDAMGRLSEQANDDFLDHLDLRPAEHVVDVGGGDGTNAMAIAARFQNARVTVFDRPSVCERARAKVASAGLQDRIGTHEGDLFETPFPKDADTLLFSHLLTIWSEDDNVRLLRKAHDALGPGGRVILFQMMGADDGSGPVSTALGSAYFLAIATGTGMLYSFEDYERWLKTAGFRTVRRVEGLPMDHGLLVATR